MLLLYLACASFVTLIHTAQAQCTTPKCPEECYYGKVMEKDLSGCDVCKCAPRPRCPPRPVCSRNTDCPNGFLRIDGCISPTCDCNSNPTCPSLTCSTGSCPQGFAKDTFGKGCPTCECSRRRSSLACYQHDCLNQHVCPVGSIRKLSRGCPVCACTPAPVCPVLTCTQVCPSGVVQENGCATCECLTVAAPCPAITCPRTRCRRGFASDANGCPTCDCKLRTRSRGPSTPTPATVEPPVVV